MADAGIRDIDRALGTSSPRDGRPKGRQRHQHLGIALCDTVLAMRLTLAVLLSLSALQGADNGLSTSLESFLRMLGDSEAWSTAVPVPRHQSPGYVLSGAEGLDLDSVRSFIEPNYPRFNTQSATGALDAARLATLESGAFLSVLASLATSHLELRLNWMDAIVLGRQVDAAGYEIEIETLNSAEYSLAADRQSWYDRSADALLAGDTYTNRNLMALRAGAGAAASLVLRNWTSRLITVQYRLLSNEVDPQGFLRQQLDQAYNRVSSTADTIDMLVNTLVGVSFAAP